MQVFFNATEYDKIEDKEEKAFFKFLSGNNADDEFTRTIAEKVNRAKKSAAFRRQYMTWEQEMKHQRWEAFEEGARQKAIEDAKLLLADGYYTLEKIAKVLNIPEEELRAEISAETSAS